MSSIILQTTLYSMARRRRSCAWVRTYRWPIRRQQSTDPTVSTPKQSTRTVSRRRDEYEQFGVGQKKPQTQQSQKNNDPYTKHRHVDPRYSWLSGTNIFVLAIVNLCVLGVLSSPQGRMAVADALGVSGLLGMKEEELSVEQAFEMRVRQARERINENPERNDE